MKLFNHIKFIENIWYKKNSLYWFLIPISWIYYIIFYCKKLITCLFFKKKFSIPIVVVGNITVGGVGKTPLVIALANECKVRGFNVGIISRGYLAKCKHFPMEVTQYNSAIEVGDEPLLLLQRTSCPVVISPKRIDAIRFLIKKYQCNLIISDDGLQHYAVARTLELVVIDGIRFLGNGWCLPAGPLREPAYKLKTCDFVIMNYGMPLLHVHKDFINQYEMFLSNYILINIKTGESISFDKIKQNTIAAVAGLGNNERFFITLQKLGLIINKYSFPDHYAFTANDLQFTETIVIMTEKDAVKCRDFANINWFYLRIDAQLTHDFWQNFFKKLGYVE